MCENKKRNLWRPVELILQVIICKIAIYILRIVVGGTIFSVKSFTMALLPTNYFVILYCVIYLISPFVNQLIDHLGTKAFRLFVVLLVMVFCIYPNAIDLLSEICGETIIGLSSIGMYGSQWGYSIVNFLLMYILGAYIRRSNTKLKSWSLKKLLFCLYGCIIILVCWARVNDRIGYFSERSAWEYCNPLIVFEAVLIFLIFSRIRLNTKKMINKFAEGAFTVFLIHGLFLPYIQIERFVTGNVIIMVAHIVVSVLLIYLACWIVHLAYHLMVDPVIQSLSNRIHLPVIEIED